MVDTGDAGRKKVVAQLKERGMWLRLVWIARWSTRELSRAEDLVQETIMRVLDPDDLPWDGKRHFLSFMSFMLRHVFTDWMRRRWALEMPFDALKVGRKTRSEDPSPEDAIDQRRAEERLTILSTRLMIDLDAADPLARRCLSIWVSGMSLSEQASELGSTVGQVKALHVFIKRRAARIRDEYDDAERERRNALQAAATAVPPAPPSEGAKA